MSPRATALALALVLFAASVPAVPADCCSPGVPARQAIRAVDCCAAMLECPAPRIFSGIVQSADSWREARLLTANSEEALDAAPRLPRLADADCFFGRLSGGPPLYRLHAQLLI